MTADAIDPRADDRVEALEAEALRRDQEIGDLQHEVEHLQLARANAAVIEQAKGILMSANHCSADDAFALLVAASRRENLKLFKVAERIVAAHTGLVEPALPPEPDDAGDRDTAGAD